MPDALAGREVFVHLDVDVLDPSVMPGLAYPAPGGSSPEGLASLLDGVAGVATIIGVEVTGCPSAEGAELVAPAVTALFRRSVRSPT